MSERVHTYKQNEHTIVLRSRGSSHARTQKYGLDTAYIAHARTGSAPPLPPVPRYAYGPPPRAAPTARYQYDIENGRGGDLLVRFGIDSVFGRVVARVLMCFLLLQPVYVAFGAELDDELAADSLQVSGGDQELSGESLQLAGDAGDGDTANSQLPTENSEDEGQQTTDASDELTDDSLETSGDDDATSDGADATNSELPTADSEVDGDGSENQELGIKNYENGTGEDGDEGQETLDDTTDTSESGVGNSEGGADDTVPHPNPPLEGEGAGDETLPPTTYHLQPTSDGATTTDDEVVEEDVVEEMVDETVPSETNAGNKYTFGEGDCTLVADGEFYCVAPTVQRYATGDPRVYAEKDREGDREIYYFDGVEIHRITNNSYDDFAPVFDDTTLRIAWQASIHDRMQIMVHELETNTTRQVTNARENSSNPHLLGDSLVWQQWVDTNWEVMMTDVDTTEEFEIERLTDNAVHDMFPQLYQGLITWQREKGASWEVIVYDLRTGVEHALQKSDDTKYENPRFVLMFDSTHENGDVETIGYDIETGEMMELGTRANPQPLEPITPKDEVPDAPVTTASSTLVKVKEGENSE